MKKMLAAVVVLAIALFGATAAFAAIANSAHDLSATSTYYTDMVITGMGTNTDACLHCHTPHASSTGALWNRAAVTTQPGGGAVDPRGSGTCIGCHDGVLNDTLVNAPGRGVGAAAVTYTWTAVNAIWAVANPNLSNDHPVGRAIPGTAEYVANASGLPLYNGAGSTGGTMVECSSCHDPHAGNGNTFTGFLRTGFACSNCHVK